MVDDNVAAFDKNKYHDIFALHARFSGTLGLTEIRDIHKKDVAFGMPIVESMGTGAAVPDYRAYITSITQDPNAIADSIFTISKVIGARAEEIYGQPDKEFKHPATGELTSTHREASKVSAVADEIHFQRARFKLPNNTETVFSHPDLRHASSWNAIYASDDFKSAVTRITESNPGKRSFITESESLNSSIQHLYRATSHLGYAEQKEALLSAFKDTKLQLNSLTPSNPRTELQPCKDRVKSEIAALEKTMGKPAGLAAGASAIESQTRPKGLGADTSKQIQR